MVNALVKWVRARKTVASAVAIALIAGVPLTFAVLHPGFPISDLDLTSRDVWVTNGEQLLGGRLNRQIDELNGSVVASSPNFDVLQDGDTLFLVDPDAGRVESVNPASTEVTSAIDLPAGAEVSYGGDVLAIMAPDGKLWVIPAVGDLQFNSVSQPPLLELGEDAHAVVTREGVVIAVSQKDRKLYRIADLASAPQGKDFPSIGAFQLAAVGDTAVVLDQSTNELITESGSTYSLGDERGLRLQQTGPASDVAIVATADSLLRVGLSNGSVEVLIAGFDSASEEPDGVAAPVNQDGCAHGAWAEGQKYLLACLGQQPQPADISEPTQGSLLEFRVNRSVIALNDLSNGNVWLMEENMRLVDNWDDVVPPEEDESEEIGEEKSSTESYEDTLAERTDTNRPPTAKDDEFGVRPGRTTILSVLDNDSDPDGDVLVISSWDPIDPSTGRLDPIDGARALQFTPSETYTGIISFHYTVDDGRGGTASASVSARVVPDGNEPPYSVRNPGVSVEANQTITYNVLSDWRDPDGDDVFLVAAAPKSGDLVRFTPDGFITFTHQTSELGEKEVQFQVTDGTGTPVVGTLTVDVKPAGELNPVGTPDFRSTFAGDEVVVQPLENDLSPSGAELMLVGVEEPGGGAVASFSTDRETITFSAGDPGVYYVKYTLQAGANTSEGLVRVDVLERPDDATLPPVAVKDTAYVRSDQPVTVSVLSNDASPTGKILAVQSIDVPADFTSKGVVVELLESTLIRVTTTQALTEQVGFTYTISDGAATATAGVTIVPVPALTRHQPPVAENDTATVRVGDIITLDALENDFHPDATTMFLDPELITEPEEGLAFVSNNQLRFQAPDEPGSYAVDYRVLDPFGETAAATATFTVTPLDPDNNRDPEPDPLVGRVLAGGTIRVDIPLQRIDPDGDSTQLLRFPTSPSLGTIEDQGPDFFVYQTAGTVAGTDEFTYQVYDAFGATGESTVKIAVIPEPDELRPPSALPDAVSIRPGRVAQVDLMLNDSDPQGAPIKVSPELLDVPEGIEAEVVEQRYLVITAPDTEQSFSLRYELTNDRGGSATTFVQVTVTPDAPLLPPVAEDLPITKKEVAGEESITVDLFDEAAFNPAGKNEDLVVTVEGPNARSATVLETPGLIEVTPGETRQAIAYRVTNEEDDLSAMAFILVPEAVDEDFADPPEIDPDLPVQYVGMNETREWNLEDILVVPSGRDAHIYDEASVSGVQSNGEPSYVDENTISFTPATDYRGPAAVNFTVSDGDSEDDPKGVTAPLTLQIVVGDPEFRDTPPEFTPPNVQAEVGETTTIDLRESTAHPNPQILQQITYSDIQVSNSNLTANLSGSQLSLGVPVNTPKGTTYSVDLVLRWDKFTVPATVNVTVVGSTRAPAVAVTDVFETKRPVSTYRLNPLTNDSNPYQSTGEPLRIVDASTNIGSVSFTASEITITPPPTPQYVEIVVVYTIEDATEDADRRVNGTINFTVTDVPAEVTQPQRDGGSAIGGDGTATIRFDAPATNGKDITSYEVRNVQTGTITNGCTAGAPCTITGLTNGTPYQFVARAINVNGAGPWSTNPSDQITPYGTPAQPQVTATAVDPWAPNGAISASWPAVGGTGGTTTYIWNATNGASGQTEGTTTGNIAIASGGNFTISVYAQNSGGKTSGTGVSNSVAVQNQAAPPQVGTPATNVQNPTATGTIQWTWGAVTASPGGSANLTYEVRVNGGGVVSVGTATSHTQNFSAGSYYLEVRAVNKAGAGPWSPASASGQISDPANTTVTAQACLHTAAAFYVQPTNTDPACSGNYLNPGDTFQAQCRGQRNGISYFYINPGPWAGYYILASNTNRGAFSLGDC